MPNVYKTLLFAAIALVLFAAYVFLVVLSTFLLFMVILPFFYSLVATWPMAVENTSDFLSAMLDARKANPWGFFIPALALSMIGMAIGLYGPAREGFDSLSDEE